jgi:hypothetical protein
MTTQPPKPPPSSPSLPSPRPQPRDGEPRRAMGGYQAAGRPRAEHENSKEDRR